MRVAALLALLLVLAAGVPTTPGPWWDLASASPKAVSVVRLALVALGAAGAILGLRGQRLARPLLIGFFLLQVPVVHLVEYAASAFVGVALYVTMAGGDVTLGAGIGSEVVFGNYPAAPYPPGIGINALALLGLALAMARLGRASGVCRGSAQ